MRRQVISSHGIDYVALVGHRFTWERILTSSVITTWSNTIKCEYMILFPLKNLARKGLTFNILMPGHAKGHQGNRAHHYSDVIMSEMASQITSLTIAFSNVACSATSHYLNQWLNILNCTLGNKVQWNFDRNLYIFVHENEFQNVVWKMVAILSRPQCVNTFNTPKPTDTEVHHATYSPTGQVKKG